jgi:hypothetical protein
MVFWTLPIVPTFFQAVTFGNRFHSLHEVRGMNEESYVIGPADRFSQSFRLFLPRANFRKVLISKHRNDEQYLKKLINMIVIHRCQKPPD